MPFANNSALWGDRQFEVLPELRPQLRFGDVRVSVVPDLHVRESGTERVIKLDFTSQEPDDRIPRIVSQGTFEAVSQSGIRIPAASVLYVYVSGGRVIRGARLGARMTGEIRAACENIEASWEGI